MLRATDSSILGVTMLDRRFWLLEAGRGTRQ